MFKYRIAIWLVVVVTGQLLAAYIKAASGILWGTPECGTLFGISLLCAVCTASIVAFGTSDRDVAKLVGAQP